MFSSARRISLQSDHRLYTPPSPSTPGRRRALNALRAILLLAVTSLAVFTAGRIFVGVPMGGARDLFTLYVATAVLAFGLAGLFELGGPEDEANRNAGSSDGDGGRSNRVSGIFRRTRDEGFRFLTKAMRLAQVG